MPSTPGRDRLSSLTDGGDVPADDLVDGVGEDGAPAGVVKGVGGDGGLLVEPEPAALAAAMVAVLDDPGRRAELRARGLARAALFGWERTARLTWAAYEEVLAAHRPARP